jgi:hypothetical protein
VILFSHQQRNRKDFQMKHTSGPWKTNGRAGYAGHKVADATGRSVAAFPSTSNRAIEERDANAKLIAAAPDLLAALEMALPFIDGYKANSADVVDAIKFAITKATV